MFDDDDTVIDDPKPKMHIQMSNTTYEGFGAMQGNP